MKKNSKQGTCPPPVLPPDSSLIDTHCHLDMAAYQQDLGDVLKQCNDHGVKAVVTIGIDPASSKEAVKLAIQYPMVKATVGIHPHDVGNIDDNDLEEISSLIERQRNHIVAYGEIGLDYVKNYSPAAIQKHFFGRQLAIAKQHDLPVIIHDRGAHEDILRILQEYQPFNSGGIFHCFSGDISYAEKVLELGFHISIPGIVTFKNATALKEVARHVPLDRLLLETDGPFLAPAPYRGKRNEPLFLLYTAAEVARLRNISIASLAEATTENAMRLLKFPLSPQKNDKG